MMRINWIDYAKGIGIFLVVIGHVLRGLISSNILQPSASTTYIDNWIYSFHMPVFFFLSGLLASRSTRRSLKAFLLDKTRSIIYPYFIWSTIQILLMILLSSQTTNQISWNNLFTILYEPIMQFWFLYTLFLMLCIFALFSKLNISTKAFFGLTIALYMSKFFLPPGLWSITYYECNFMMYFGLGVILSELLQSDLKSIKPKYLGLGVITCFILLSFLVKVEIYPHSSLAWITALLGISGLLFLSELLCRYQVANFLEQYGIASLQIFVAHIIASATTRIILRKIFSIENVFLHLSAGVFVGLYLPIWLNYLAQKVGVYSLFTLPKSQSYHA